MGKKQDRIDHLKFLLRWEAMEGQFSRHACVCGRGAARKEKCKLCLSEELSKLERGQENVQSSH